MESVDLGRWKRATHFAAKIGRGLSKHENARILEEKQWLEAIDKLHRYGRNLRLYFRIWKLSNSSEPFFKWLDGEGKQVDLEDCPRQELQQQCVLYLAPEDRDEHQVTVRNGKLVYRKTGDLVDTTDSMKWIFVLSTSKRFFVGKKEKGFFHHSSFLAGDAVLSAGGLLVSHGTLKALSGHSGHYHPKEENLNQLIQFLKEKQIDLSNVELLQHERRGTHNDVD